MIEIDPILRYTYIISIVSFDVIGVRIRILNLVI